ncbi:MAG: hypothetical protein K2L81_06465, partial [Muribaculaceae bacterium]|nr:hypothetical protein [Muribaculaceae bacterium]
MNCQATLSGALNLAPDPRTPSLLRPVRIPGRFTTNKGEVLCHIRHSGGSSLLLKNESTLTIINDMNGLKQIQFTVDDTIYCATAIDNDVYI